MRGAASASLLRGVAAVLLIVLAATWAMLPVALAQQTDKPVVSVFSYQTGVKLGEEATFIFHRTGDVSEELDINAAFREWVGPPPFVPSGQNVYEALDFTFPVGARTVEFTRRSLGYAGVGDDR